MHMGGYGYDRKVLMGAAIADELRQQVWEQLGYTCSAGVAPNKMLAKMVRICLARCRVCAGRGFQCVLGERVSERRWVRGTYTDFGLFFVFYFPTFPDTVPTGLCSQ